MIRLIHTADWQISKPYPQVRNPLALNCLSSLAAHSLARSLAQAFSSAVSLGMHNSFAIQLKP